MSDTLLTAADVARILGVPERDVPARPLRPVVIATITRDVLRYDRAEVEAYKTSQETT